MTNVLIVGSGAREHALAIAISKSSGDNSLYCYSSSVNPGIEKLSKDYKLGDLNDNKNIVLYAQSKSVDFVIVGPENPLSNGLADELLNENINVVGPTKMHARIESSKGFAREILNKYNVDKSPYYEVFSYKKDIAKNLEKLKKLTDYYNENYVIKADGLCGGKGVKVYGDHLNCYKDTENFAKEILENKGSFVFEEKLEGEEFSLISFCDGTNISHMPIVQDHKRAYEDDKGPNTGGMGSYSDANHSLPFLSNNDVEEAKTTNEKVMKALNIENGTPYKGFLYGGFMATKNGVKVIEYNCRFGDPEAINLLSLLDTDFVLICKSIIRGDLDKQKISFLNKASVCKYLVPVGYPDNPKKGFAINFDLEQDNEKIFFSSVGLKDNQIIAMGSRTLAVLSIEDTIYDAEKISEQVASKIKGELFYRKDIGTKKIIEKKNKNMETIRESC